MIGRWPTSCPKSANRRESFSIACFAAKMSSMLQVAVLVWFGLTLCLPAFSEEKPNETDQAFSRLYNFDFRGAHAALNRRIISNPEDPLSYAVRASADMFY